MRKRIALRTAFILVAVAFLVSNLLFWMNRGFGGGHGRFDLPIGILAIPWLFIWPVRLWELGDFYALVLGLFLMNVGIVTCLWAAFCRTGK